MLSVNEQLRSAVPSEYMVCASGIPMLHSPTSADTNNVATLTFHFTLQVGSAPLSRRALYGIAHGVHRALINDSTPQVWPQGPYAL